ncbi:sugar phosphate isomerase/epimerase, partial [bacterium]|nr:sugar phosphate isomerase/epimerase [bacterium]
MKLGYSTWGMPKVPIDSALAHLAGLGFEGVELTVIPGYTTELRTLDAAARRRIRDL